ncbi:MAG: DNA gyrase subunit A, partial [Planctomycetota bacterium]|nr:DNA gyrase subunit A [Planctomycetota bacterium]
MKESYLTYALSVIHSRALPDVRDGLKPSQRRILYAMHELNLGPRSKHRKCAKICGDTSGKYHPHGEQVVYPTLVRMGQTFNSRYVFIDKQGNFGSNRPDNPAAMRYTEARMSRAAVHMLEDIDKDTVDFIPNYDGQEMEPTVLPGCFPNLLCNGSSGIAVGMATSLPPNNLTEIASALELLLDKPDCDVDELLEHVQGPDFPTGGIIMGRETVRVAYRHGRGLITVRARHHIEEKRGRRYLVFTQVPYQITVAAVIESTVNAVKNGKIDSISDINDETNSRVGLRLVIELKKAIDEIIRLAVESVGQARSYVDDVEFSPEDGSRTELDVLVDITAAAVEAGATTINIPDTVGYAVPEEYGHIFAYVREKLPELDEKNIYLSAHCHNDLG